MRVRHKEQLRRFMGLKCHPLSLPIFLRGDINYSIITTLSPPFFAVTTVTPKLHISPRALYSTPLLS